MFMASAVAGAYIASRRVSWPTSCSEIAQAAELLRHGHLQVASRLQLVEVFLEESVLPIVGGVRGCENVSSMSSVKRPTERSAMNEASVWKSGGKG